jgi:hypothetical protein
MPCIFVYSFYYVYLWGLKVPIISLLSIISMMVAPGICPALIGVNVGLDWVTEKDVAFTWG